MEADAERARELDRVRVGRRLGLAAAIEDGDLVGAELDGGRGGVQRRAPAADHADAPAEGAAPPASPVTTGSRTASASKTPSRPSPGTPRRRLRPRPIPRKTASKPASSSLGRGVLANPRAAPDLGAGALDLCHLVGGHLAGVPPRHDAVGAEPAGLGARLEHRDVDPGPPQLGGAGEAGRARPDDGDALARRRPRHEERPAGVPVGVHRDPLERADRHRTVERDAHAGALAQALDRADAGARAAERVRGQDRPSAAVEVAGGDGADEPGHVDAGGARRDTRRVEAEEAAGGFLARCLQAQPGIAVEPCHRSHHPRCRAAVDAAEADEGRPASGRRPAC